MNNYKPTIFEMINGVAELNIHVPQIMTIHTCSYLHTVFKTMYTAQYVIQ